MFKVLVIAYYFPPMGLSGVQRTLKFVKYMQKFNWEPTVITTGMTAYFAHDESLLKEAEAASIRIIRTSAADPNSLLANLGTIKPPGELIRKILKRISQTFFIPDNKVSWSKKAFKIASKILEEEKFNIIFVTMPPFSAFNTAAKLKKKFNIPLIADYRDLWYNSHLSFYPTPLHSYLHKKMEYNSLKAADKVTVTNRRIKENLLDTYKFLTFDDVAIIPHGFDYADFESVKANTKHNLKMILTYSGIFYEHNTPQYFLKAFKQLSIEQPDITSNIELHFVGYLGKESKKLIRKLKLEEFVKDHGYLDHKDAVRKIVSSDVLWMMLGRWRHNESILPGKIYEYVGSRKPIIACVPDGAAKTAAQEYGASFIAEPDDIKGIKNTIVKVFLLYQQKALPVPNEEYVEKFRRDYLTEQLTQLMQFLIKEEIV
jgi:glycosyltransferase involved in cell wall biosynthesis